MTGLAAAVIATWLIATQGDPSALYLPLMGLAWGIANGLSVAFYIMYPKKLFARWGSFAVTGIGMFIGGIVAAAVSRSRCRRSMLQARPCLQRSC